MLYSKHLGDRKALSVHIYYIWCDIILIFKLHRRTRRIPRSSTHSLKIRMTSHPCNKYGQITLSYLLSVKDIFCWIFYKNRDDLKDMFEYCGMEFVAAL